MFNNFYPQMTPQYSQNGLVSVQNESEARSYPVGYGNSVMFKDETQPYIYVKTMGCSQLEQPKFEKYRLVKETVEDQVETYADKSEVEALKKEIESLREMMEKKVKKSE